MNAVLGDAIVAIGTVVAALVAALIAANRGIKIYEKQKRQDRKEDLIKRRQHEYERYLTAFTRAGRWKGVDDERHAEAESEYHEAHDTIMLVGSDEAIKAANAFHRYYVDSERVDPKEAKMLYANMVVAMRKDGFEETGLSIQEVAKNIPWTMGDENLTPIDWGEVERKGR